MPCIVGSIDRDWTEVQTLPTSPIGGLVKDKRRKSADQRAATSHRPAIIDSMLNTALHHDSEGSADQPALVPLVPKREHFQHIDLLKKIVRHFDLPQTLPDLNLHLDQQQAST